MFTREHCTGYVTYVWSSLFTLIQMMLLFLELSVESCPFSTLVSSICSFISFCLGKGDKMISCC